MPKQTFVPILLSCQKEQIENKILQNGVRLSLVAPSIPNYISIVLLFPCGVQNETTAGSGFLRFLKYSIMNRLSSNPTILNHIQISYDKETFLVKIACMSYQVSDFVSIIAESLKPDTLKLDLLQTIEYDEDQDNNIKELLESAAFGEVGKGKPSEGLFSALQNKELMFEECLKLHKQFFRPENMIVCAGGVYNNNDFSNLLEQKFKNFGKPESVKIESSEFNPRLIIKNRKNNTQNVHFDQEDYEAEQIGIAFKTNGIRHDDFFPGAILETLLGESSYFSSGGPGKGMHALAVNVLRNCGPATHVLSFRQVYSLNGLFGIVVKGTSGSSKQIYKCALDALTKLSTSFDLTDFERAQNITISKTLMGLEGQHTKIEEFATNLHYFGGKSTIDDYVDSIQKVKIDQLRNFLERVIVGDCCVAAIGEFEWLKDVKTVIKPSKKGFFG